MLITGLLASSVLIAEHPSFKTIVLLMIAIWGFCRAYYFAFYVIQNYIDPDFRYSGLIAFLRKQCRS